MTQHIYSNAVAVQVSWLRIIYQGTQEFTRAWAHMGPGVATPHAGKQPIQVIIFHAWSVAVRFIPSTSILLYHKLAKTIQLVSCIWQNLSKVPTILQSHVRHHIKKTNWLHVELCMASGTSIATFLIRRTPNLFQEGASQSQGGLPLPWLWLVPPWICWEFYFTCKSIINKGFNYTMCRSSPGFYQIVSN